MAKPGAFSDTVPDNFPDKHILASGVACRYLMSAAQFKSRGGRATVAYLQEMGGKVRVVPSIPFKLVIFDDESAVMPLDPDNYDAVRRMAAKLSAQVGASGRFELGVRAAQRGWVD